MERIPVCGKCLKTGCYVGLTNCDNELNFILMKTEEEIREIGKEKVMCQLMYPDEVPSDWNRIPPIKYSERFVMCFKELK